jgi:hypothetical protein
MVEFDDDEQKPKPAEQRDDLQLNGLLSASIESRLAAIRKGDGEYENSGTFQHPD